MAKIKHWICYLLFPAAQKSKTVVKRVPKGTSEYQAAWIADSGDENEVGKI
jgi:hypothetical protein